MEQDYFSYLQTQLSALRDDSSPVALAPPRQQPAPAPAAQPSAPPPQQYAPPPQQQYAPPPPQQYVPPQPSAGPVPRPAPPAPPDPFLPPPHRRAGGPVVPPPPAPAYFVAPGRDTRGFLRAVALVAAVAMIMLAVPGWAVARLVWPAGPGHPSHWDARVVPIVRFVEHERGLAFKHPVYVDFLAPAAFKAKMGDDAGPGSNRAELDHVVARARALGLLHGSIDLAALDRQMVTEQVVGVYEPGSRRVYVRGDQLTPQVRVTLAHELTHALQDQHFAMAGAGGTANADESAARALIEGDAMRIEAAYADQLAPDERKAFDDAERAGAQEADANTADVPEALTASFAFPYVFGPGFVTALLAKGGNPAVDAAFRRPPLTDAEVIDPLRYVGGVAPLFPRPPSVSAGDHRAGRPAAFGEMSSLEMLGAEVGYVRAWKALEGWRGDIAVPFSRSGKDCMAVATRFDTPAHAAAFAGVANDWALASVDGAVLEDGTSIQVEGCDPGAAAPAPPAKDPSPLQVLQMRAAFLHSVTTGDKALPPATAACIADRVIAQLGPETFAQLIRSADSTLPPPARQAFSEAATACRPG